MLKIKLARFGKKKQPHYRIVVNEARDKRDGKYTALLGHYAPTQQPKLLQIDLEAYADWIKKGAQPTEAVGKLHDIFKAGKGFAPRKKKKNFGKKKEGGDQKVEGKEEKVAEKKEAEKPAEKAEEIKEEIKPEVEGSSSAKASEDK
jgi:small subunit ribosomal protein S16